MCADNLDDVTILGYPDLLRTWLWRQKVLSMPLLSRKFNESSRILLRNCGIGNFFFQDVLDSVYNACLETSLLYKKAEAVQKCSSDKSSPVLGVIMTGLEKAAVTLSACKVSVNLFVLCLLMATELSSIKMHACMLCFHRVISISLSSRVPRFFQQMTLH